MQIKIADIKIKRLIDRDLGDLQSLADSILTVGLLQPIAVTKNMELVYGQRRLEACKLLGLDTIEATLYDREELLCREAEIEENIRRKQYSWEEEARAKLELHKLKQYTHGQAPTGRPSGEKEGWGVRDTANILGVSHGHLSDEIKLGEMLDVVPELKGCVNKRQAIQAMKKLEENAIIVELQKRKQPTKESNRWVVREGNCLALIKDIEDESVDLILTDPPFGVSYDKIMRGRGFRPITYKDVPEEIENTLTTLIPELFRVLKQNSHCYIFSNWTGAQRNEQAALKAGFNVPCSPLVWGKKAGWASICLWKYLSQYELINFFTKGNGRDLKKFMGNLFLNEVPGTERKHPVQRPLSLLETLIQQSSEEDELVLDCFAGSGSTLVAAKNLNRRALGFELAPEYAAIAKQWLEEDKP